MYQITDIDDLVVFYGGKQATQDRFCVTRTAIDHWRIRGLPTGWHSRIMCDLVVAGKTFDPALFRAKGNPGADIVNGQISKRGSGSRARRLKSSGSSANSGSGIASVRAYLA